MVGRILEGAALEDKRVYQQMYQEMIQYNGMINSSYSVLAHYAEGGATEVYHGYIYCNRAVCPSVRPSVFYKYFLSLAKK